MIKDEYFKNILFINTKFKILTLFVSLIYQ